MKRLAELIVPFGFRIACRRATSPTSLSPCSVKATTEGVVREPSALAMTVGCPPSTVAITEFVVPRSMPTALAIAVLLAWSVECRSAGALRGGGARRDGAVAVAVRPDLDTPGLGLVGHGD